MALSQESVLFGIGSQLRNGHYSLIGLLRRTSRRPFPQPLYSLDLSRFAACSYSNKTCCTSRDRRFPLYGTLSVVTYPLLWPTASWGTESRLHQFDQQAEAFTTHRRHSLTRSSPRKPYWSIMRSRLRDWPRIRRPPLWVTVLGRMLTGQSGWWNRPRPRRSRSPKGACAQKLPSRHADTGLISTANIMILPHSPAAFGLPHPVSFAGADGFAFLVRNRRKPGKKVYPTGLVYSWSNASETYNLQGRVYYLLCIRFHHCVGIQCFCRSYLATFPSSSRSASHSRERLASTRTFLTLRFLGWEA